MIFPLLAIYFGSVFFTKTPPGGQILLVPGFSLEPERGHACHNRNTAVSQMPFINIKLVQFLIVKHQAGVGKAGFVSYVLVSLIRTLLVQKYVF